jgi:D-sedoheptulose 7-phosphate isomerase
LQHQDLQSVYDASATPAEFARGYLDYLARVNEQLDADSIAAFIGLLDGTRRAGGAILIAGNGGSAATASHMALDLGMDVLKKVACDPPFRALSLCDNTGLLTAIANDDGYDNVFINQMRIQWRAGDLLVVISASGNSPNVVAATKWAQERGGKVAALTGFDGGILADLADVSVVARTPAGEYGPVEDVHMILDHLVASYFLFALRCQ